MCKSTIHNEGRCSTRSLAKKAKISCGSAQKAINSYLLYSSIPIPKKKGTAVLDLDPSKDFSCDIMTSSISFT